MAENYFGITDTGRLRDNNEDAFIAQLIAPNAILACVIDGVGGYEGGEVAARLAKETIIEELVMPFADQGTVLKEAFIRANKKIYQEKLSAGKNAQMACVLTAALVLPAENELWYAHVGDTRMYLLRDGSLVKVTKDQSFVGFLEDSGRLSEAEAMAHPKRNEINKALGFDAQIDAKDDYIETGQSPFLPGDMLMLCSDGLTDLVNAKEMTNILLSATSLQQKGKALIDAANSAGGKDNITVVLVKNDKKQQKQKATKPVLIKKEPQKVDGSQTAIATKEATPKLIEPQTVKPKKSNALLWLFVTLSALLALTAFWLWTKNKDLEASLPKPVAPHVRNADEKRLSDSLGLAMRTFNFTDSLHKTIVVSDTIFIRQDSLHIDGNGLVLQSDSAYGGPAFVVSSNSKYLLLENVTLKNFQMAIIAKGKGLQLKNVRFEDCVATVERQLQLPLNQPFTALLHDTVIFKKDSVAHKKDSLPK